MEFKSEELQADNNIDGLLDNQSEAAKIPVSLNAISWARHKIS